jgi:hypothetical protein
MESRNAGRRLDKSLAEDLARSRGAAEQRHKAEEQRFEEKWHRDAEQHRRQMGW